MKIYTGFHSVEERIRSAQNKKEMGLRVLYAKPGPRVKKIISQAKDQNIPCSETTEKELNSLVSNLPETAREHRGIILISENEKQVSENKVDFSQFLKSVESKESSVVVILDSITDPHNVGAIIRSCDQFGVDLVVLPERRGVSESEITMDTNFVEDLDADSLDLVDMLMSLEDEFNIGEVPDEMVEKIRTVGQLVTYIEESM